MNSLIGKSHLFKPGPPAEIGMASQSVLDFLIKNAEGRILDLGGGIGAYSLELQKLNFDVTLSEKDPEAVRKAMENGVRAIDMNTTTWQELYGKFDTVIMVEVLEHILDYRQFFLEAFKCSTKKVLFTVPCNDDFQELFNYSLTYNHIAVSDHINHFTSPDLKELLSGLNCKYEIKKGDFLFPNALVGLFNLSLRMNFIGKLMFFPFRLANKAGMIPKKYPTRFFVQVLKS